MTIRLVTRLTFSTFRFLGSTQMKFVRSNAINDVAFGANLLTSAFRSFVVFVTRLPVKLPLTRATFDQFFTFEEKTTNFNWRSFFYIGRGKLRAAAAPLTFREHSLAVIDIAATRPTFEFTRVISQTFRKTETIRTHLAFVEITGRIQ